jgi:hypothetical protein
VPPATQSVEQVVVAEDVPYSPLVVTVLPTGPVEQVMASPIQPIADKLSAEAPITITGSSAPTIRLAAMVGKPVSTSAVVDGRGARGFGGRVQAFVDLAKKNVSVEHDLLKAIKRAGKAKKPKAKAKTPKAKAAKAVAAKPKAGKSKSEKAKGAKPKAAEPKAGKRASEEGTFGKPKAAEPKAGKRVSEEGTIGKAPKKTKMAKARTDEGGTGGGLGAGEEPVVAAPSPPVPNTNSVTCCRHSTKASQLVPCNTGFRSAYMKSGQYFDLNQKCVMCQCALGGKMWYCFDGFENRAKGVGGVCGLLLCTSCKDDTVMKMEINGGNGRMTRRGASK